MKEINVFLNLILFFAATSISADETSTKHEWEKQLDRVSKKLTEKTQLNPQEIISATYEALFLECYGREIRKKNGVINNNIDAKLQ